jgi:hypothetical protein
MLADLRREGDVDRVALHGLDAGEVEQFVVAAAGHELDHDGEQLARMLHDETEGNPFFMGQVLHHLVESGAIVERDGRWTPSIAELELGIPEGVREVVGRRLAESAPPRTRQACCGCGRRPRFRPQRADGGRPRRRVGARASRRPRRRG